MASHSSYWSNSAFADWLRGSQKGGAKTWEDWDTWHTAAKSAHPIRYWLVEEGLDYLQDFVTWPVRKLYDIKYYVTNRWIDKSHALVAHPNDVKPGTWCDVSQRILFCLFNELQDFVEVELAWFHIAWEDRAARVKYKVPFWASGWFRTRTWRCPQAGVDNLAWQMNLVYNESYGVNPGDKMYGQMTFQAETAKEILDLYKWWTETYRNRPDPYEASGWSAYCDSKKNIFSEDTTAESRKRRDTASKKLRKMEAQYKREEEQMLIRLIRYVMHSGPKELTDFRNWLRHLWNEHVAEVENWNGRMPDYSMRDYFQRYKWWLKREFQHRQQRAEKLD